MLKKRSRSTQKDQQMGQTTLDGGSETCLQSNVLGQRQKTNSFFNVPGLFVGLTPKVASDCDSVRSPTSPLDFKLFCNLGSCLRYPKSSQEGTQKCWECQKIGLGSIVDSLDEDDKNLIEKDSVIPSSNSRTILFGSQIRSKGALNFPNRADFCEAPKSLPKIYAIFPHPRLSESSNLEKGSSDVLFEIGGDPLESDFNGKIQSFSMDSKSSLSTRFSESKTKRSFFENESVEKSLSFDSENKLMSSDEIGRSLTPEEIELSEDYTCVISHGPNPKTTHIFGDCVLECHPNGIELGNNKSESLEIPNSLKISPMSPFPTDDFLSYCHFCKNKLEEGKDIYMYRGEKAFCSWDCRLEEISIEEEKENSMKEALRESPKSENGDDIFENSMFVAI